MIKLVAIDVDGTLLNRNNQLTVETKEIISQVRALGIKVVLCTGRPFQGIQFFLDELGLDELGEYAISFNGAVTQALGTHAVIRHQSLTFSEFLEIETLSRQLKMPFHIQSDNGIYTANREISQYTAYDSYLNGSGINYRMVAELRGIPINKVLFVGSQSDLTKMIPQIPQAFFEKYHLVRSLDYFFEFLPRNANKGNALKALADDLGITPEEMMAIGDNDNDVSMLDFVGLSVAMENGSEKAKQSADFITKSNEANGVDYALSKLVLQNSNIKILESIQ